MKINRSELLNALEKVKNGLANKDMIEQSTSFAFLGGRVVTYNDEISISCPVKGMEKVIGAVKAQALYEFLAKVKRDEIELDWEDNQVIIKAGRAKAGLLFESDVKLPINEEIKDIGEWKKLPDDFLKALELCQPCCSRDMSRPVLTCVHVNKELIEASDSYQVIQYELSSKVPGEKFLIPASSVKELIKYEVSEIARSESWVHFKTANEAVIFSARVVSGNFPAVAQFFKVGDGFDFNFPDNMQEALGRANVFVNKGAAKESIPHVSVEIDAGRMILKAKNEFGWFQEKMSVKNKEVSFKFSIGIEFLIKLFEKLKTCIIDPPTKVLFTGDGWKHVVAIMPAKEE